MIPTQIIDEIHMSSDSANDDGNEIVEPTTLHLPVAYIEDITGPIEFAMILTDLLRTRIVLCRNLWLTIR